MQVCMILVVYLFVCFFLVFSFCCCFAKSKLFFVLVTKTNKETTRVFAFVLVLYEDETVNGMVESAKLFDDMTKLDTFKNCALILILNKDDLLEALLRSGNHGLEDCFSEKGPWQNPEEFWETSIDEQFRQGQIEFNDYHQEVVAFIGDLFENRNNLKTRMYKHTTIATRNQVVKQVCLKVFCLVFLCLFLLLFILCFDLVTLLLF